VQVHLYGCYICFTYMLQVFYLDIAYVGCFCKCLRCMFQVFDLSADVCCKCFIKMF
jgi:hypothetical protein